MFISLRSSWKKGDSRKNGYQDDIFRAWNKKKFELTNVETHILKGHLLIWQGQMVRDKWWFQRGGWEKGLLMFIRLGGRRRNKFFKWKMTQYVSGIWTILTWWFGFALKLIFATSPAASKILVTSKVVKNDSLCQSKTRTCQSVYFYSERFHTQNSDVYVTTILAFLDNPLI